MNEQVLAVLFYFSTSNTSLILIFRGILQDYQPNTELDIKTKQKNQFVLLSS